MDGDIDSGAKLAYESVLADITSGRTKKIPARRYDPDLDPDLDPEPDPRPVFEGDWQSATGVEKGQHSERVRQWRKRQEAKGLRRMVEPSNQPERDTQAAQAAARDADLATLDAIIAAPKALASDKIRAVEARQRILARQQAEAQADAHGPLLALRNALDAVPAEQRVEALHALVQVGGEEAEEAAREGAAGEGA